MLVVLVALENRVPVIMLEPVVEEEAVLVMFILLQLLLVIHLVVN